MKIKKILIASPYSFIGYNRLGAHQYSLQFSNNDWQVAYISNPLSPFNTLLGRDKKLILYHLKNHIKNGIYINDNLWNYVPFTFIPFHNHTVFGKKWFINNYYKFTVPSIKSVIKNSGYSSVDVLWLDTPHQKFWKDIIDYKCLIYRVADNLREFRNTSDVLLEAEEEVIQSSDFILMASKMLLKEWKQRFNNEKLIYCPNGVDLSNFIRNQYNKPKEFYFINNPIALYVGAIEEWFDRDLLINIAKECMDINFVVIGADRLNKMRKPLEKNIYYLGPKNYIDIPNYIYYCDCGLIPFNTSKLVQSVNPIKMYEFSILGKPIISRSWNELKLLNSPSFLANNVKEFVDILKDEKTYSIDKTKLINYAMDNTWHNRYLKIVKMLEKYGI